MVTKRPGTPIARNRNPNRAVSIASTPCVRGVSRGDATAARQSKMKPNGNKNQPPRPRSVIRSKTSSNHCGKVRAQALAAVSMRNMQATEAISMTMTAVIAPARSRAARARERRSIAENSSARFAAAWTRIKPCRHSRRPCGSEYRDADRPAGADVVAVNARSTGVLQTDRFGTQRKGALLAALDEGEAAGPAVEEIGGARGISQACLGAGKK